MDPVPASDTPPPMRPPTGRTSAVLHAIGAALAGFVLVRAIWTDDYLTLCVMVVSVACNIFMLWDTMKDRQ